ncbi:hypothetical protein EZS27_018547 [termite gut metagenome]|uniref:DUF4858 domain-containing protein n=1 Tax=termite gut metagenome TaxID=433724 RepID=A0A5J4RFZ8_9ZZZZ
MKQHLILLLVVYSLSSLFVHAQSLQWTKKDSLNLSRLLKSNGEIKLNRGAVTIDFGGGPVTPSLIAKPALKYDETLPSVYQENEKRNKTYDFLYQPNIINISNLLKPYSNWTQTWRDARPRNSREEIEATSVHYNSGSTISGLDFMKPFTKEFWDAKGRARRARTLEVLEAY